MQKFAYNNAQNRSFAVREPYGWYSAKGCLPHSGVPQWQIGTTLGLIQVFPKLQEKTWHKTNKETTDKQTKNNNRESEFQKYREVYNLFEEGPYLGYFINWLPNISTLEETHTLSPHLGNF